MATKRQRLMAEAREAGPEQAGCGQVLCARIQITIGRKRYQRGQLVDHDEIMAARNKDLLLRSCEWRDASKVNMREPELLPEPETAHGNPSDERIVAAVKTATAQHLDPVEAWRAAVVAVEAMLHESRRHCARDLLISTATGGDLHARAQRVDAERFARANNLNGRRPVRVL